jgi:hypothetical protein
MEFCDRGGRGLVLNGAPARPRRVAAVAPDMPWSSREERRGDYPRNARVGRDAGPLEAESTAVGQLFAKASHPRQFWPFRGPAARSFCPTLCRSSAHRDPRCRGPACPGWVAESDRRRLPPTPVAGEARRGVAGARGEGRGDPRVQRPDALQGSRFQFASLPRALPQHPERYAAQLFTRATLACCTLVSGGRPLGCRLGDPHLSTAPERSHETCWKQQLTYASKEEVSECLR